MSGARDAAAGAPAADAPRAADVASDANPLALLSAAQIQQLQRVFYMLDKDSDGRVSEADIERVLRGLGSTRASEEAKMYFSGDGAPIESTAFLTLMSAQLRPLGDLSKLVDAFESFDEKDEGFVDVSAMKEILAGDDDAQAELWLVPAFLDRSRQRFNYRKCTLDGAEGTDWES
ncbi:hypothetical protein MSPP1_003663 [Malassezia sp. CBS 17886]|nr:hypothetical protein MSPP1_003663 [Malassezia sp. CBS 17886]